MMQRYEEFNLQQYTDNQSSEMVFTHASNAAILEKQQGLTKALRNPYIDLYQWCKGEIYDMQAINTAIQTRVDYLTQLRNLQNKKLSTEKSMANATAGKKNIMGSNDTSVLATQIESTDREIEALRKLCDWQTVFLADFVLKAFKEEKGDLYKRLLQQFSVNEIQNSHNLA